MATNNKHSFTNSIGHSGSAAVTANSLGMNQCNMGSKPVSRELHQGSGD